MLRYFKLFCKICLTFEQDNKALERKPILMAIEYRIKQFDHISSGRLNPLEEADRWLASQNDGFMVISHTAEGFVGFGGYYFNVTIVYTQVIPE